MGQVAEYQLVDSSSTRDHKVSTMIIQSASILVATTYWHKDSETRTYEVQFRTADATLPEIANPGGLREEDGWKATSRNISKEYGVPFATYRETWEREGSWIKDRVQVDELQPAGGAA